MGAEGEGKRGSVIMDEPIPIKKDMEGSDFKPTVEEWIAVRKQTHDHRVQNVFLAVVAVVVLGFLTPLIVWLTRLALGG